MQGAENPLSFHMRVPTVQYFMYLRLTVFDLSSFLDLSWLPSLPWDCIELSDDKIEVCLKIELVDLYPCLTADVDVLDTLKRFED